MHKKGKSETDFLTEKNTEKGDYEMTKDVSKTRNIQHTVRIYDDDLLRYIDELFGTKIFISKNEIINRAIEFGIPQMYKELLGKNIIGKTFAAVSSPEYLKDVTRELKEMRLTVDDIFVIMNVLEHLVTTTYNIELAKMSGIDISDDEVRGGLLSALPENLQKVKDEVLQRRFKNRKEKK